MRFSAAIILSTTLMAQAADSARTGTLYDVAKDFGVPASIVIYVVVEGNKREKRFETWIAANEKFARTQLVELWRIANAEIRKNTAVLQKLATVLSRHGVTIEFDDAAEAEVPDEQNEDDKS